MLLFAFYFKTQASDARHRAIPPYSADSNCFTNDLVMVFKPSPPSSPPLANLHVVSSLDNRLGSGRNVIQEGKVSFH